jgi:hypothetical protein
MDQEWKRSGLGLRRRRWAGSLSQIGNCGIGCGRCVHSKDDRVVAQFAYLELLSMLEKTSSGSAGLIFLANAAVGEVSISIAEPMGGSIHLEPNLVPIVIETQVSW